MAYAAVVSLVQILKNILNPHPAQHQIPYEKQQIESLLENLSFFHDYLLDSSQKRSRTAQILETKIRDAAYKAEDLIESRVSEHFSSENWIVSFSRSKNFSEQLKIVTEEIDSIKKEVIRMKDSWDANDLHKTHSSQPAGPSRLASSGNNTMVGSQEKFEKIKNQLVGTQSKLQIIPIIGMGGIGKTTLAQNLYHDEYIEEYFDVRAQVTISQNYRVREILFGLLLSMKHRAYENSQESDDQISEHLYKCLKCRRYLILMDDLWDTEVWNQVRMLFPDDRTGSRILLTTRLSGVAASVNPDFSHHHLMDFLNDTESWNLLRHKVFGEEFFPPQLEEVGKNIARNCKGLPFTILVISGHLSKVPRTLRQWKYVAEDVNSVVSNIDMQSWEMLSLSYDHLPHHLKPCFLHTGIFPEDFAIPVSKLVHLWSAEGFLKPIESKSLEEVAEEYLADLISRNLILIGEKRSSGKIKTCKIHDLTREFCLRKAEEENFLHSINTNADSFSEGTKDPRRLSCLGDILGKAIWAKHVHLFVLLYPKITIILTDHVTLYIFVNCSEYWTWLKYICSLSPVRH